MSQASVLIAKGKAAVEAELTRIETDVATVLSKAEAEKKALATELQNYLQTHATEVSIASTLIARATGTASTTPASPAAPAATLAPTTTSTLLAKIKTYVTWKGVGLTILGLLILDVMHRVGKL